MTEAIDEVNECFNDVISLYNSNPVVRTTVVDKCLEILKDAIPESIALEMLIKVEESIAR